VESNREDIVQDVLNYLSCNGPYLKDAINVMKMNGEVTVTRLEKDNFLSLVREDKDLRLEIKRLKKLSYIEPRLRNDSIWCSVVHL